MRPGRTALVVATFVILQVALFPHLRVGGVVPDLGLVLAAAVAYRHGPEAGAVVGFASGLAYDLFLETPTGMAAITYALTAYGVGVLQAGMLRAPAWIPVAVGFGAGLAGGLLFVAVGVLAGVAGIWADRTLQVVVVSAVYDALLAPGVFWLVRRVLDRPHAPSAGWPGA
ncbi:MAG: hypothetical protein KatS3mg009_2972 [Acidimicrobiia bacterium]|nr:MAG: hypothetical protein KatS3mg009_2972 [Acidimicrobiia bacterium]